MITVACVLRSGSYYDGRWVEKLQRGVAEHLTVEHEFVCFTDRPWDRLGGAKAVILKHRWPGWWSKMELFRPRALPHGTRVLYLDLDTLIVGNLDDLASYHGHFAMLRDWFPPYKLNSGVMSYVIGDATEAMWEMWRVMPFVHMEAWRGDGDFIRNHVSPPPDDLMALYPKQIATWKENHPKTGRLRIAHTPPLSARLICGHGGPRFSDPRARWAHDLWVAR